MPEGGQLARSRADAILGILERSGATDFVARVRRLEEEVREAERGGWLIDLQFVFRDPEGLRLMQSPTTRGPGEPLLMIEERLIPSGEIVAYNYDVVFPEWDAHFGYHLHGHRGPAVPHIQGFGVQGAWAEQPGPIDLELHDLFWELTSKAFEMDQHFAGS